jgi:AcrR family transcriptional regulator
MSPSAAARESQSPRSSSTSLFCAAESEPARRRLLLAALRLFAENGFAKTSIRRIAAEAGVNIASVSYYFGSKAGLYRAVFWGDSPAVNETTGSQAGFTVASLDDLYRHILEPLRSGELARYWIKLHRREMLEPTGIWQEKVDRGMLPMHAALVAYLCRRLDIREPDDEVHALAVLVVGPAVHILVNCEVVDAIAPQLLAGADAVDLWRQRLVRGADAMIVAERRRRGTATARNARSGSKRTPRSKA